jgi:hypothetical protein
MIAIESIEVIKISKNFFVGVFVWESEFVRECEETLSNCRLTVEDSLVLS